MVRGTGTQPVCWVRPNAGPGHANAHMRGLPRCEVLQHRSSEDGHERVASGGCLLEGRHKDVCAVLGKWRQQVVKDGMSPDVLRADLLAFLRQ